MAKAKFTPGRWFGVAGMVEVESNTIADICSCYPGAFEQEGLERKSTEIWANATLISYAPDMFKVLPGLIKAADILAAQCRKNGDRATANMRKGKADAARRIRKSALGEW